MSTLGIPQFHSPTRNDSRLFTLTITPRRKLPKTRLSLEGHRWNPAGMEASR